MHNIIRANKLVTETSPFLPSANNPVEWYPWGEKAFEKNQGVVNSV